MGKTMPRRDPNDDDDEAKTMKTTPNRTSTAAGRQRPRRDEGNPAMSRVMEIYGKPASLLVKQPRRVSWPRAHIGRAFTLAAASSVGAVCL